MDLESKSAHHGSMSVQRVRKWSALLGVLSTAGTLAVAELVAFFIAPASSPFLAVGSLAIDLAPSWLKDFTIALFGTNDKLVLLLCLVILVLLIALAMGILEFAKPSWGVFVLVFVGVIATVAVTTRAQVSTIWPLPTMLGVIAGVLLLRLGMIRLRRWVVRAAPATDASVTASTASASARAQRAAARVNEASASRRDFLRFVGVCFRWCGAGRFWRTGCQC